MRHYKPHEATMLRSGRVLAIAAAAIGAAAVTAAAMVGCGGRPAENVRSTGPAPAAPGDLRPPEAFAAIADRAERARALFVEASRVMLHPRCVNCHPAGDVPAQGELGERHEPPVLRGPDNNGIVGMECTSCHQDRNLELARVPGAPKWALAPIEMAWVGRTPGSLCEQVKDPARNGGKTIAQIVEHSAHDELLAWGWNPGSGRAPAPGTQVRFGALMAAWAEAGAACPREESGR